MTKLALILKLRLRMTASRFARRCDNSQVVDYYRPIFWITPLKAAGEKGYSLSVGFLFQEEGAPLPAAILAGQRRRAAPIHYDSVYPTFRTAAQARNGLGHELRRGYSATMS